MAFFLIGRGPDDDLRLISPNSFESRQAAMAELSLLSAEPTFAHWDAEVSVMDLDTGAPVLLVRSGVAAVPAAELPVVAPGDASGAWEADLPPAEEPAEEPALAAAAEADVAPLEPAPTAEPMLVAEASAPETPVAESDVVPDAIGAAFWEPPTMPLIEPVEDAAIADAIVEEAPAPEPEPELKAVQPPEPAVEPAIDVAAAREPAQETPVVAPAFDENDELRAAILRTTEHMSAEGVVPPASVGLEPAQAAAQPEASAEPELDAERSDAEPVVESGQPEIVTEAVPAAEAVSPVAEPPAQAKVGFWPWARAANSSDAEATGVAPEVAGVYDALQEPATELPEPDVEAALRNSVLLSTDDVAEAADHASDTHLPMSGLPYNEPSDFVPAAGGEVDSSDFILDLDAVESAPVETAETISAPVGPAPLAPVPTASDAWSFGGPETPSEAEPLAHEPLADEPTLESAPEPVAAVSPLQDYTCEDCVYVTTCPNRDQRLPKDCGSFQWR